MKNWAYFWNEKSVSRFFIPKSDDATETEAGRFFQEIEG